MLNIYIDMMCNNQIIAGQPTVLWRKEHGRNVGETWTPARAHGGRSTSKSVILNSTQYVLQMDGQVTIVHFFCPDPQGDLVCPIIRHRPQWGQTVVSEVQEFWEPKRAQPSLGIVLPCFSPDIAPAAAADTVGAAIRLTEAVGQQVRSILKYLLSCSFAFDSCIVSLYSTGTSS